LRKGTSLQSPILVVGFPGLGRVGRIAMKHLVRSLKCDLVGLLTSPFFSPQAIVTSSGSARLTRGEIYCKHLDSGQDILLLTGDEHYQNIEGEYEASYRLLTFFKRHGGGLIVTLGGHITPAENPSKVFCFATTKDLLAKALSVGAVQAPKGTPIVGISGSLVALAKLRGVPSLCLLGETLGLLPDFRAAKNVLTVLVMVLGLEIDLSPLERGVNDLASVVKELDRHYDSMAQTPPFDRIANGLKDPSSGPDYVS
jgi:uncharacterized protein (TIGR00162 family)